MCTRYLLLDHHYREILQRLGISAAAEFLSRFNLPPGIMIPAVRAQPKAVGQKREAVELRWGLVPAWSQHDDGVRPANARAETIADKPAFRDALRFRRCLIPASGFYEWEHRGRSKQPWLFRRRDQQPFGLAGIWERWQAPDGSFVESCAVITTEPNELMRPLHHRMPVMLSADQFEPWLDPTRTRPPELRPLLQTPAAADMTALAVSTYVSNSRNEGPACLEPATAGENGAPQLSLAF